MPGLVSCCAASNPARHNLHIIALDRCKCRGENPPQHVARIFCTTCTSDSPCGLRAQLLLRPAAGDIFDAALAEADLGLPAATSRRHTADATAHGSAGTAHGSAGGATAGRSTSGAAGTFALGDEDASLLAAGSLQRAASGQPASHGGAAAAALADAVTNCSAGSSEHGGGSSSASGTTSSRASSISGDAMTTSGASGPAFGSEFAAGGGREGGAATSGGIGDVAAGAAAAVTARHGIQAPHRQRSGGQRQHGTGATGGANLAGGTAGLLSFSDAWRAADSAEPTSEPDGEQDAGLQSNEEAAASAAFYGRRSSTLRPGSGWRPGNAEAATAAGVMPGSNDGGGGAGGGLGSRLDGSDTEAGSDDMRYQLPAAGGRRRSSLGASWNPRSTRGSPEKIPVVGGSGSAAGGSRPGSGSTHDSSGRSGNAGDATAAASAPRGKRGLKWNPAAVLPGRTTGSVAAGDAAAAASVEAGNLPRRRIRAGCGGRRAGGLGSFAPQRESSSSASDGGDGDVSTDVSTGGQPSSRDARSHVESWLHGIGSPQSSRHPSFAHSGATNSGSVAGSGAGAESSLSRGALSLAGRHSAAPSPARGTAPGVAGSAAIGGAVGFAAVNDPAGHQRQPPTHAALGLSSPAGLSAHRIHIDGSEARVFPQSRLPALPQVIRPGECNYSSLHISTYTFRSSCGGASLIERPHRRCCDAVMKVDLLLKRRLSIRQPPSTCMQAGSNDGSWASAVSQAATDAASTRSLSESGGAAAGPAMSAAQAAAVASLLAGRVGPGSGGADGAGGAGGAAVGAQLPGSARHGGGGDGATGVVGASPGPGAGAAGAAAQADRPPSGASATAGAARSTQAAPADAAGGSAGVTAITAAGPVLPGLGLPPYQPAASAAAGHSGSGSLAAPHRGTPSNSPSKAAGAAQQAPARQRGPLHGKSAALAPAGASPQRSTGAASSISSRSHVSTGVSPGRRGHNGTAASSPSTAGAPGMSLLWHVSVR